MLNNQTGLKRLIFAHAAAGELPPINEYTITGNPATFSTNLIQPLQAFEIPFMPVQSGFGDPSPENVRSIAGWAGLTIVSNSNQVMLEWQSAAGIVYGGVLDVTTGILTISHVGATINQITGWQLHNNTGSRQAWKTFDIGIKPAPTSSAVVNCISNIFAQVSFSATWQAWNISAAANDGKGILICVPPSAYNTVDEMIADIGDTQICYELDTPQTVQLSPVEIKTIIGRNSIGATNNGTNTIKYLKRG